MQRVATDAGALIAIERAKRTVPRVIRRLALHYDVTASDLAEQLGVTRAAVSSRLNGKTVIRSEELAGLAHYFGVPILVFYLEPDEALRWVLDHPEHRPEWLPSEQAKTRKSCYPLVPGQRPFFGRFVLPASA